MGERCLIGPLALLNFIADHSLFSRSFKCGGPHTSALTFVKVCNYANYYFRRGATARMEIVPGGGTFIVWLKSIRDTLSLVSFPAYSGTSSIQQLNSVPGVKYFTHFRPTAPAFGCS